MFKCISILLMYFNITLPLGLAHWSVCTEQMGHNLAVQSVEGGLRFIAARRDVRTREGERG